MEMAEMMVRKIYVLSSRQEKGNGVGIVLRGDIKKTVVEVIRVRDRLMAVRVQMKNVMIIGVWGSCPPSPLPEKLKCR